jgi:hypothetical protein
VLIVLLINICHSFETTIVYQGARLMFVDTLWTPCGHPAQHVKTLVHATVHPCQRPVCLRLPLNSI